MSTLLNYKCPCCNGAIEFDSSIQKMKCPFCDTEFDIETLRQYDEKLNNKADEKEDEWDKDAPENWDVPDDFVSYSCQSCGGQIIADGTTIASSCPFCDNPVIITGKISGMLKPDWVIPFKLDKKAAVNAFKSHLSGKKLLPKSFKSQNHLEEIKGVYVPFWLFDCSAYGDVTYRATKVRRWSDSKYNYRETSFFLVSREGSLEFVKVPVDGSTQMADDLMDSIEPYNYKELKDFQTAYLSGYLANKYDVDSKASKERASQRIKQSTIEAFRRSVVGYATCTTDNATVNLSEGSVKYALLPVWLLTTKYKDQLYTFAMNGQTGKFVGNLPVDRGAAFRWGAGITAAIGAIASAILILMG